MAVLSLIDQRLDELKDEFGDLPELIRQRQERADEARKTVEETNEIINNIKSFCSTSKVTLIELKEKEEKLAKQQFLVRNNKEFDAITNEIQHIQEEHQKLSEQMRKEGVKQENLTRILEGQEEELREAEKNLAEKQREAEILSSDQNEELNQLMNKRKKVVAGIDDKLIKEYERIRKQMPDAAVRINRNSCSGCFSAIPPQKIVEIRNNLDDIRFCENCGRMLTPEEFEPDEEIIEAL
ncbi:MAG: zinc ribbon domain-containing protein [Bacteroidota bacterium]